MKELVWVYGSHIHIFAFASCKGIPKRTAPSTMGSAWVGILIRDNYRLFREALGSRRGLRTSAIGVVTVKFTDEYVVCKADTPCVICFHSVVVVQSPVKVICQVHGLRSIVVICNIHLGLWLLLS